MSSFQNVYLPYFVIRLLTFSPKNIFKDILELEKLVDNSNGYLLHIDFESSEIIFKTIEFFFTPFESSKGSL